MDQVDIRHRGADVTVYRDRSESSDDDGDNDDAESNGERALNL